MEWMVRIVAEDRINRFLPRVFVLSVLFMIGDLFCSKGSGRQIQFGDRVSAKIVAVLRTTTLPVSSMVTNRVPSGEKCPYQSSVMWSCRYAHAVRFA